MNQEQFIEIYSGSDQKKLEKAYSMFVESVDKRKVSQPKDSHVPYEVIINCILLWERKTFVDSTPKNDNIPKDVNIWIIDYLTKCSIYIDKNESIIHDINEFCIHFCLVTYNFISLDSKFTGFDSISNIRPNRSDFDATGSTIMGLLGVNHSSLMNKFITSTSLFEMRDESGLENYPSLKNHLLNLLYLENKNYLSSELAVSIGNDKDLSVSKILTERYKDYTQDKGKIMIEKLSNSLTDDYLEILRIFLERQVFKEIEDGTRKEVRDFIEDPFDYIEFKILHNVNTISLSQAQSIHGFFTLLENIDGVVVELVDWGQGSLWSKLRIWFKDLFAREETKQVIRKAMQVVDSKADKEIFNAKKVEAETKAIEAQTMASLNKKQIDENFELEKLKKHAEIDLMKAQAEKTKSEAFLNKVQALETLSEIMREKLFTVDSDFQIELNDQILLLNKDKKFLLGPGTESLEEKLE